MEIQQLRGIAEAAKASGLLVPSEELARPSGGWTEEMDRQTSLLAALLPKLYKVDHPAEKALFMSFQARIGAIRRRKNPDHLRALAGDLAALGFMGVPAELVPADHDKSSVMRFVTAMYFDCAVDLAYRIESEDLPRNQAIVAVVAYASGVCPSGLDAITKPKLHKTLKDSYRCKYLDYTAIRTHLQKVEDTKQIPFRKFPSRWTSQPEIDGTGIGIILDAMVLLGQVEINPNPDLEDDPNPIYRTI